MNQIKNKSEAHRRRLANQQQYAPRVRSAPAASKLSVTQDPRLRKLTVEVLDELKRPDAVPSVVIYKALTAAAAGLG